MNEPKAEFSVTCPKCKRRVKVREEDAEAKMSVTCPCGEKIALAKGFGA